MAAKICKSCSLPMFNIALLCFFIRCSFSAPIEPVYANFVRNMNSSNCSSPEQIRLPLNASTTESNDNKLSAYLKVCQNLETVQQRKEAHYLCQEIFDNLKVILCPPISAKVLAANLTLSKDVCEDIKSLKEDVPENKVILKRLTDVITCQLMCDGVYENACQVLLWSHQLQQESEKTESLQKEAKENSLQAGLEAVADNNIPEDQNKANQEAQKMNASEEQTRIVESTKKQSSNDLLSTIPKGQQQNPIPELHGNPESNVQNPSEKQPKEQSFNHNLPLNLNNSVNADNKVSQDVEIKNNEIPGQDIETPNAGPQEQEDPHDKEEFSHNELDTNVNQPQLPDNILPEIKVVNDLPNHPNEEFPDQNESNTLVKLSKNPVDETPVEPHDTEEVGEETGEETEPKIPTKTDKQKTEVDQPNQNNEASQSKTTKANDDKTTLDKASTTHQESTDGSTKKLIPTTNKETSLDEKTLPAGKTQSTLGQKSTELPSSLPSQKSSSLEPTTPKNSSPSTATLEEMEGDKDVHERPEDREPDPYTDLENTEGDPDEEYSKQEYGGIYEPAKNKETLPDKPNEVEVPKVDVMRPREQSYNDFSPRNNYNRQPEVMPVFPDQEDGHFFFYFLSLVLILMGGYLLFHNKQKIIALIVEGRHERRRRSHGVGYKKLETK